MNRHYFVVLAALSIGCSGKHRWLGLRRRGLGRRGRIARCVRHVVRWRTMESRSTTAPAMGTACTAPSAAECEYGSAWWDVACDSVASCTNGTWSSDALCDTPCFPEPGENPSACPANPESIQTGSGCPHCSPFAGMGKVPSASAPPTARLTAARHIGSAALFIQGARHRDPASEQHVPIRRSAPTLAVSARSGMQWRLAVSHLWVGATEAIQLTVRARLRIARGAGDARLTRTQLRV